MSIGKNTHFCLSGKEGAGKFLETVRGSAKLDTNSRTARAL